MSIYSNFVGQINATDDFLNDINTNLMSCKLSFKNNGTAFKSFKSIISNKDKQLFMCITYNKFNSKYTRIRKVIFNAITDKYIIVSLQNNVILFTKDNVCLGVKGKYNESIRLVK